MQQYNQTQGSLYPVYPPQAMGGLIQPPPPVPPRAHSQSSNNNQPATSWGMTSDLLNMPSPWGDNTAKRNSWNLDNTSPFHDNFVGSHTPNFTTTPESQPPEVPKRISLTKSNSSPLSASSSGYLKSQELDVPKQRMLHQPLISLSPTNTFDRNVQTSKYSSDLEGIDFNALSGNITKCETKNTSSASTQKLYPDISHAFTEVRREEQFKQAPPTGAFRNSVGMSYGWNPSLFGAQPTTAINQCYGRSSYPSSNPHHMAQTSWGYGAQRVKNPAVNPYVGAQQQSNFHMGATMGASNILIPGSGTNFARPASSSDFENLRNVEETVCDNNVFSELEMYDTNRNSESEGRDRRNSDLMHFSESDEKEYMSLDFFDPLYSRTRRESVSSKDNSLSYSFFEADDSVITDVEGVPGKPIVDDQFEKLSSSADALEQFLRFSGEPLQEERSRADTPERPPPPRLSAQYESEGPYEKLHHRMFVDEESDAFCQMVTKIKTEYKSTDTAVNRGFVVSAVCDKQQPALSVKVIIHTDYAEEPINFTCDIHSNVEHVISNVLYNHLNQGDMMSQLSTEDFILKVYDRTEYLLNYFPLSKYEYVHSCLKLDRDIQFQLYRSQDVPRPFLRTVDDDVQHLAFPKNHVKTDDRTVTKDQLETLMNTFYKEIESMRDHILKKETSQIHSMGVVQAVKAVCMILAKIETVEVSRKLKKVEDIVQMLTSQQKKDNSTEKDKEISMAVQISLVEELEEVLEKLLIAVNQLVKMYCRAFHTDFILGSPVRKDWSEKYVTSLDDDCIVQIASAHRIPVEWTNRYDGYSVICSLHFGRDKIGEDVVTDLTNQRGLCDSLTWDQWISFKDVALNKLPRETRLCMTLCGMKGMVPNNQTASPAQVAMPLGGVTLQLYSQKGHLLRGSHLVPLKMNSAADPFSPFCSILQPDTVLLQINFPDFGQEVIFPDVLTGTTSVKKSFDQLLPDIQDIVHGVLEKDCISSCQADELGILWQYRHYLYEHSHLLPWILQGSNIGWDYRSLSEIYALLTDWPILEPMQALELLLPQYPDSKVREFAVTCLKQISSDELADFLPQLVQALKYESYHASHLARLLLEQSCQSVRFAHQFFWLLKGAAAQDVSYKRRYELMFAALINVAGDPLYQEFRKQEEMVKILTTAAEKVQVAKDRESVLKRELEHFGEFFDDRTNGTCLLPYNPGLAVTGIDAKSCSYFTSNAVPLKLVFRNPNIKAEPVYTMFKVGDDLRQDMLTMQMIRLMDRLWLKAGLDLKIITFACLATGPKKGIVEIITESDTLRKIQVQAGLTGSFKDRPIKEWLQGHNPTELEYQKAVENFTCSCAGYCVATYVLGVCDRHNDNIMLKQSGHMFHIDFNKFLGDSQMFGNIKRDRVPFVLTSDMAHVINNGEKRNDKFQHFIDLCCQAFNILRKNANLFLNLFALNFHNTNVNVSRSGIPGVSEGAARYIQRALLPGLTEAQASAVFTRMIEDSLKSVFTQFNFFIHNLGQLKFSSHQEGALLSFVPKTYSFHTDGKLQSVEMHGYQKRYQPDKHYIYIFKIQRVNQKVCSYIFRHFSEFVEFSNKIREMFPLTSWPPPPSKYILGRSHIQTVAESRKVVIEKFLDELWQKSPEICESDIVYTFFHPLLRDEQEAQKEKLDLPKLKENPVQLVTQNSPFGLLKLSVHYKKDTLYIMIMHAKELPGSLALPSPYVKTYLLPDPDKQTKRKTKIIKHSTHPTYNEVIEYKLSIEEMRTKTLQVSVWDHDMLKENNCLGAVYIKLRDLDLSKEVTQWYKLEKIQITDSSILA